MLVASVCLVTQLYHIGTHNSQSAVRVRCGGARRFRVTVSRETLHFEQLPAAPPLAAGRPLLVLPKKAQRNEQSAKSKRSCSGGAEVAPGAQTDPRPLFPKLDRKLEYE